MEAFQPASRAFIMFALLPLAHLGNAKIAMASLKMQVQVCFCGPLGGKGTCAP